MNRFKFAVLGVSLGLLTLAPAAPAQTLLEKVAATVLADQFGIDTSDVLGLHSQVGGSIYDLAPVYETAHYCKASPDRVWALRNQGLGWGQVAHKLGMQPGTFNKLRNQGAFDRDRFWTTRYQQRFSVPVQQVTVIRQGGGSLEDILGSIIIGKLSKQSPQTVYDTFRAERSWVTVSDRYQAPLTEWRRVSVPVRTVYYVPRTVVIRENPTKWKVAKPTKSKGSAHGGSKVKSHGNSGNGKSHGNQGGQKVHGKGKGNSGSHGNQGQKSKGGGNGKGHGNSGGGKGHGKGG